MRVLTSLDALEAALASAASDPVLFFKHSETCGMSLQAHEEMRDLVADPEWPVPVYLVSVQASRPVSNAMAARFGVRHASPQVLLVATAPCSGTRRTSRSPSARFTRLYADA